MSISRSPIAPPVVSLKEKPLFHQLMVSVLTTLGAGTTVACALYPFEVMQTRSQLGRMRAISALPTFWPLFSGFLNAEKAAITKNAVLSQRDTIHRQLEDVVPEAGISRGLWKTHLATVGTAGLIGTFDTALTNYFANLRIRNIMGEKPALSMWKQKIAFMQLGIMPRLSRNFLGAFCCISAATVLQPQINALLPAEQYRLANVFLPNLMAGTLSGVSTNWLDLIHKRQVGQANLTSFKTASAWQVAKSACQIEGLSVFFRGAGYTVFNTVMVFSILNGIPFEKYAEEVVESCLKELKQSRETRPGLFQAPTKTPPPTTVSEEQSCVRRP